MSSQLSQQNCGPCMVGAPVVTDERSRELMRQIPSWQVTEVAGVKRLQRDFPFVDFKQALAFSNRVGFLAEAHNHHPEIVTSWGGVTVSWWTHKIKGLHENDFIMAAKTDQLFI